MFIGLSWFWQLTTVEIEVNVVKVFFSISNNIWQERSAIVPVQLVSYFVKDTLLLSIFWWQIVEMQFSSGCSWLQVRGSHSSHSWLSKLYLGQKMSQSSLCSQWQEKRLTRCHTGATLEPHKLNLLRTHNKKYEEIRPENYQFLNASVEVSSLLHHSL